MRQQGPAQLSAATADPESPARLSGAVVGYVAAVLGSALVAGIAVLAGAGDDSLVTFLAGQVAFWSGLTVIAMVASRRRGSGSMVTDFGLRATAVDGVQGVPLGVAAQLVAVPLLYLPVRLFVHLDVDGPARELADRASGLGIALLAVSVVVMAPVVEELFFRGVLLGTLRNRWGTRWAIAGSSLVFGVTHFQPVQFPALAGVGVLFAVLAVRSGRLGPAVLAHAGFNAASFAVMLLTA